MTRGRRDGSLGIPPFATLPEMLQLAARGRPDRVALTWEDESLTCAELWRRSGRFAERLRGLGVGPGERAVLALPNSPEFFSGFYGILRTGAAAVPLSPESGPGRILDLGRLCHARAAVLPASAAGEELERRAAAAGIRLLRAVEDPGGAARGPADLPAVDPRDLAYIQYTSGSTGDPKGVEVSHANVTANVRQLIAGFGVSAADVFVSWLPVHHDMGLVLMTLVPLAVGARLVLLPASLRRMRSWVEAIARHRGTFTAAPDFAWRLCLRTAGAGPPRRDLASLRVALDAAEPVRAGTLARFVASLGREGVMVPGYGLAEATVGVCAWPPGGRAKVDGRGLVSVGRPFPGVEIRILRRGRTAAPGEVGEILVRSAANTRGYFGNPRATARLHHTGGWLRTGDLGYVDPAGDLFIVGRRKNVVIQGGRTVAPQEVEEAVEALPFVRAGAAVGVDRGDLAGEQLYVFAEVRRGRRGDEELCQRRVIEIVAAVRDRLGLRPGRAYLLAPGSIPRTPNGKLRHSALRESYLAGRLHRQGRILFPAY